MNQTKKPLWKAVLEHLKTSSTNDSELSVSLGPDSTLLFIEQHSALDDFQHSLNYLFKNKKYLIQALCHSSFANEQGDKNLSYERLEFLGDSILGMLITKNLFLKYPHESEGKLSVLKGSLVNENCLAQFADLLFLGNYLLLGRGEIKNKGYERKALLADCFESLLGALYLDGGLEACEKFLLQVFGLYQDKYHKDPLSLDRIQDFDFKTKLQEKTMELYKELPQYHSKELENNLYEVKITLPEGSEIGPLQNSSKKKAQKKLAEMALLELESQENSPC